MKEVGILSKFPAEQTLMTGSVCCHGSTRPPRRPSPAHKFDPTKTIRQHQLYFCPLPALIRTLWCLLVSQLYINMNWGRRQHRLIATWGRTCCWESFPGEITDGNVRNDALCSCQEPSGLRGKKEPALLPKESGNQKQSNVKGRKMRRRGAGPQCKNCNYHSQALISSV